MANTKKKAKDRKISKTYAITRKVVEEFQENLEIKGLCASNVVEALIIEYNKNN